MDFVNSYATPPPYSRLDEENQNRTHSQTPQQGPQSSPGNDYPLAEPKKEESRVTINFEDVTPNSHKETYRCILKGFLCGCSLRAGCITVAVLYSIYMVFFTAIAISFFIITYIEEKVSYFSSLWGFNVAMFECCMALFIIVFISVGVHKQNSRRLHVAKWLMVVDLCLNMIEEVQIAFLMNFYGLLLHFVMQIIPIYFIFVVHSYEAQLEMSTSTKELPAPRTDSDAAFTSTD